MVMLLSAVALAQTSSVEDAPEGVNMLMQRNGIPAVFDPVFVTAADAEIPAGAWVLGVVMDGQARAYDLNLLNHHEIVNDVVAGKPIASVW